LAKVIHLNIKATSMMLFLMVYAAIMVILSLGMLWGFLTDSEGAFAGLSVLLVVLFGAAAFFIYKWNVLGYYALIAALVLETFLLLAGFDPSFPEFISSLTAFLSKLMVNLFIIFWLLHGDQRRLFK